MHYLGCPIEDEDQPDFARFWCSTKVDINRNHIANQNEYGYCADNCPVSKGVDIIIDDDNIPIKFPSKPELDYDYKGAKHIHYHFHNHNGKPCDKNHDEEMGDPNAQSALLPTPNHPNSLQYPLLLPNDHFQKLNHKPSNADGTPKENPFNMNFNKMESDANYTHWQDMKGT